MGVLEERTYKPDCRFCDTEPEMYYNKDKKFGRFIENGSAYRIDTRQTPRQWLQYLCNDKIRSVVANDGAGFIFHRGAGAVTKYWSKTYLVRGVNGRRTLRIGEADSKDFFAEADSFSETVRPGYVTFEGKVDAFDVTVVIFVPAEVGCECWRVSVKNTAASERRTLVRGAVDWMLGTKEEFPQASAEEGAVIVAGQKVSGIFTAANAKTAEFKHFKEYREGKGDILLTDSSVTVEVALAAGEETTLIFTAGVFENEAEKKEILALTKEDVSVRQLAQVQQNWQRMFDQNRCTLPDKNTEYFLNFWLKNQLYLTYRYDRGATYGGYRDALQDSWGYCLADPHGAKKKIQTTLCYMYPDGRCPRQYDDYNKILDERDFSDSPIWAADAVCTYIKETGDFDFWSQKIGFYGSDETATVEEHLFRALDYMYHSRGKNGLILMRDGDWADGLEGINKYGADATSVWVTIAAFYAQNILREMYLFLGDTDKAALMEQRCAEYRKIVNTVGWDGNWYAYGFFEDGEPIGSHKNLEGKIWCNPQTWALFSGIPDSEEKIKKIEKSINRYLFTPFGAMVCYPPYVFYGERCGRVQRQVPGTFLNGSVYNHGASFKIFADVARGDYDDALDTLQRTLPNHPDNSDCCRTSEPYAVGNVYYGSSSRRYGMNLFTWFTAAAAWIIHGGFEQILGVRAGFDGVEIHPHVPKEWQEYSVEKQYRGTHFTIHFVRSEQTGIWVNGAKIEGNIVRSAEKECAVTVYFNN